MPLRHRLLHPLQAAVLLLRLSAAIPQEHVQYGADVSIPIHHDVPLTPHPAMSGRQEFYDGYMKRWRESLVAAGEDPSAADYEEMERLQGNREQTQVVVNFTDTGFKKMRAPERVFQLLTEFWEANRHLEEEEEDSTVFNGFDRPTGLVNIEDEELHGAGRELRQEIWDVTRDELEAWTGLKLVGSSIYGIRVYKEGHALLPHVDRAPLIISAIINVAQDVDEDWPLEVYDKAGHAVNITMQPGDIIFYESHSLIHGRPFALKGRYYANIFVHFEPERKPTDGEIPTYFKQDISEEMLSRYYYEDLHHQVEGAGEVDYDLPLATCSLLGEQQHL
jgi:prolyl 4-hydroxylase